MKHITLKALGLSLTVPLFALAGCSTPTPGQVVAQAPATSASPAATTDGVVVEDEATDSASPSAQPTTATLGSTVKVGDWEVKVTKVTKNANRIIKKANMFNDKPDDQYMLVEYTAKYVGEERKESINSDLTWSFTDADQTVLDEASVVTPADDKNRPTEARRGGSVKLDVAFDVDPKLINGGIISVEDAASDEYADWQL